MMPGVKRNTRWYNFDVCGAAYEPSSLVKVPRSGSEDPHIVEGVRGARVRNDPQAGPLDKETNDKIDALVESIRNDQAKRLAAGTEVLICNI